MLSATELRLSVWVLVCELDGAMDVMMKDVSLIALAQKCACNSGRFLHGGRCGLVTTKVTLLRNGSSYDAPRLDL